jgi:hypothetical protein
MAKITNPFGDIMLLIEPSFIAFKPLVSMIFDASLCQLGFACELGQSGGRMIPADRWRFLHAFF